MQSFPCRPSPPAGVVTQLIVGADALAGLGAVLPDGHRILLVADIGVVPGPFMNCVMDALPSGDRLIDIASVDGGEVAKKIGSVVTLWDRWLAAGAGRDSVVVAVGGGALSDVVGFAAATYLRGVPWIVVPTTILAMADAAIGGKTGINLGAGKNLAGAVHHPLAIVADLFALLTLSAEQYADGWAEVVKAGVIGDARLLEACETQAAPILARDPATTEAMLVAAMRVKVEVVEADSDERSRREILNFGHSAGHALERSVPGLSHGRAVAIGMAAEAEIAERLGRLPKGSSARILAICRSLGIVTELPGLFDEAAFVAALGVDKKRRAGRLRLALPARLGGHSDEPGVAIDEAELVASVRRLWGAGA